jgi:hypothetical protein
LDKINDPVPKLWKSIRSDILEQKEKKKKYLTYTEFQQICESRKLSNEDDQLLLIKYLRRLGFVLYYEESALSNYIFINPDWITQGLYEVLKEQTFDLSDPGFFNKEALFEKWQNKGYIIEERNLLLNLMLKDKFDICYKLNNSETYLVPVLLSDNKKEPNVSLNDKYVIRYKFPFMPFGLFSQLIVRLSDLVFEKYVWLSGVWLKDSNGCYALLENYKEQEKGSQIIEAKIWGDRKHRINILSRVRSELNYLKETIFKNLNILEQIPCYCEFCQKEEIPYFHNRLDIENMIDNDVFQSQCKKSGKLMPVGTLLNSILDQDGIEKEILNKYNNMEKSGIHLHLSDFGKSTVHVDTKSESSSEAKSKSEATNTISISIEVQNFLGETEMLKEDIDRELRIKKVPKEEIDYAKSDIEVAEKAIQEIELAQKENLAPKPASKKRLERFINEMGDENSTINKTLKMLRKGKDYGVQLAEIYNKIAQNTGMPSVPPMVLDVIKKI